MLSSILNFLFPSRCPVCGGHSDYQLYNPLCTSCWRSIERYTGPACGICGIPTVSPAATLCERCMCKKPPFTRILYYGIYAGALKEAIHLLKFGKVKRLSKPLGLLLYELPLPVVDGIVPVPIQKRRLRERGFNQTANISRWLSKALHVPLLLDMLKKHRETPPQTEVTGKERLKNIRNAFSTCGKVTGQDLLLVDDVITTGATVRECAKTLRDAGARSVTVVALARSMPKQNT